MAHVFTFTTSQFDRASERDNPINPIAGEGVLKWLAAHLDPGRFVVGTPDTEDWGWYADVVSGDRTYLLGASGEWGQPGEPIEWTIQLELQRSVWEKVSGKNMMARDDALSTAIESILRSNPEFSGITADRDAS